MSNSFDPGEAPNNYINVKFGRHLLHVQHACIVSTSALFWTFLLKFDNIAALLLKISKTGAGRCPYITEKVQACNFRRVARATQIVQNGCLSKSWRNFWHFYLKLTTGVRYSRRYYRKQVRLYKIYMVEVGTVQHVARATHGDKNWRLSTWGCQLRHFCPKSTKKTTGLYLFSFISLWILQSCCWFWV